MKPQIPLWRALAHSVLWFWMTFLTLWALGVDLLTAARFAWLPFVCVATSVGLLGLGLFALRTAYPPDDSKEES